MKKTKIAKKELDDYKEQLKKDKYLYSKYGIRLHEWAEMFNLQGNVCFICKEMPKSGRLSVDHIHVKGFKQMDPKDKKKYVRGLLCFLCNTGLKGFEKTSDGLKNRQRLEGTYEYFKKYKLKGEE